MIKVKNTSDRPIQVGSHYHFAEVNPGLTVEEVRTGTSPNYVWRNPPNGALLSKCTEAKGRRLNIAAGKSVRFEPGDVCCVELVEIEGYVQSKATGAVPATDEILGLRKGTV
ncbi:urease subunit beta [Streptomyces sp. NPDC003379]